MVTEMKQTICPACGCQIAGAGYEKNGVRYCCEPCASGSTTACECGCCHPESED